MSVDCELSDFEFTYTERKDCVQPAKASDLVEIRIHFKEHQFDKDKKFEALHYVQMVLDETSIDILRKCQGFIPKNNKEIVSIIEEKQTLDEENKQLHA